MLPDWLPVAAYGLGALLLAEVLYLFLRRATPRFRLRSLYHLWALALASTVALAPTELAADGHLAWKLTVGAAAVLTALVAFALLDIFVFQRPWDAARGPIMPRLSRDVLRVLVLAAVVLAVVVAVFNVPLTGALVSTTVLSAVIGLALQDILKNAFAGMALDLERPFSRGDWLLLDGTPHQVVDMTWRSTRLRTNDGLEVYEPNATLATSRVVNLGSGRRPIARNFDVGLPYEAPPARVKQALEAAVRGAPGVAPEPPSEVFVAGFEESAVRYRARVWTTMVANLRRFEDGVYTRIWYELKRQGLPIPFPIRTLHLHSASEEEGRRATKAGDEARQLLSRLELFRELSPEAVAQLAARSRREHYDDGETLFQEGARGDSLFVVADGRVRVGKSGGEMGTGVIQLAALGVGDFFGEMSLLTGEPRSATVAANGGCEVLVLSKDDVAPLLEKDPKIAEILSHALAARQAETAATLAERRGRLRSTAPLPDQETFLHKIRSFFKLGAA
jgi:small-conductance mechanosensitive channel/CRP-like cAMP-binding protein